MDELGPLYPPHDTEDWLKCPAYRDYNKRWHQRDNDWTPNRLLGEAIAAGLACFYKMLMARPELPQGEREDDAQAEAHAVLAKGYVPQEEWTLDGLKKLVDRGLQVTVDKEPLPPGAQVVCVEKLMHRCRPDIVWRLPQGLTVHDWKVRYDLEKKWEEAAQREYLHSWQLRHNAWAVEQTYGEQVVQCSIGLIALTPRTRYLHYPVPMTPRRLANWEASARLHWARMKQEEGGLPPMNLKACHTFPTKDRRCPMFDACHTYDRDETLFPTLYVEVLR